MTYVRRHPSVLALHLLQSALVHANTLLQEIRAESDWAQRMTDEDRRALSPLFWARVNPYGRFVLEMDSRLDRAPTPETPYGRAHPPGNRGGLTTRIGLRTGRKRRPKNVV